MEFHILGPLEVIGPRGEIELSAAQERTLLIRLLLDANRPVTVAQLIEALWEDKPPASATRTLRVHVSRLRTALGESDRIETTPGGYMLRMHDNECDALRFEALVASRQLREALALWRGEPLAEVADTPWARVEAARLKERRLTTIERQMNLDLDAGRHADIADELAALCAREPLREGLWASLMLALYRSGRQAAALTAFSQARAHLVDELGIEPGPALREMQRRILAGDPALDHPGAAGEGAGHAPVSRSAGVWAGNISKTRTSFVAGSVDVAALSLLLLEGDGPLTLVGPPGTGKTRVALELAFACRDDFPGGTWLVELAPVSDPELLPVRIAEVVGAGGNAGEDPIELIAKRFEQSRALLVLDNCEHLTAGCADVVERLQACGDRVAVLATSRERLSLDGELVQTVAPLPLPETRAGSAAIASAPACQLFLERSAAPIDVSRPDTAAALAEVCRRLDGLPLAIELAAARTSVLSVVDIAARLDDALGLLQSRRTQQPERQRTLRALVQWSYSLLDEPEQVLLRRLAVFAGGAPLDAVEQVCATAPLAAAQCVDVLQSLAERSLIVADTTRGRARYRLLETIRLFALEQLREADELGAAADVHASWCTELVARAQSLWENGEQAQGFDLVAGEQDNWRAALQWLIAQGDGVRASRLAAALGQWWYVNGRTSEGRAAFEAVIALPAPPSRERAMALRYAGALARINGDIDAARRHISDGISVAQAADDRQSLLQLQISLGAAAWLGGDTDEATVTLTAALGTARALRDRRAEASVSYNLAVLARNAGELDDALSGCTSAQAAWQAIGDQRGVALASGLAASVLLRRGERTTARARVDEALRMLRGTGYAEAIVEQLETVAALDALDQAFRRAARLLGHADAVRRAENLLRPPVDQRDVQQTLDTLRAGLGPRAESEFAAGSQLGLDDAITLALEDASRYARSSAPVGHPQH